MRPDVLVVVPTYNEAENVVALIDSVLVEGVDVLIVDDGSPDGTGSIAEERSDGARVHVLHRALKEGLGPAYAAGFSRAIELGAEIICEMDADFSHDPKDIKRLVAAIDDGADLAIGSRYVSGGGVENWAWHRRLLSRLGNLYSGIALGVNTRDLTGGYRAFRADALRRLDAGSLLATGYGFQIEMAWKASTLGMRIEEVPIIFRERERGSSKMSGSIAVEALVLVSRWGIGRLRGRLPWPEVEK